MNNLTWTSQNSPRRSLYETESKQELINNKSQITNPKQITIPNDQNKKNEPNDLGIGFDIEIL
jgi:hypothetical protein